ncbi:MAG: hypothetical protein ACREV3_10425 [Gammaproteobacteria bacterium]
MSTPCPARLRIRHFVGPRAGRGDGAVEMFQFMTLFDEITRGFHPVRAPTPEQLQALLIRLIKAFCAY